MRLRVVLALALASCPACATVQRRAEVVSLASRILDCPAGAIRVETGPIDQICSNRSGHDDGSPGPCLDWMPLEGSPSDDLTGWRVEGCGHVDRYATPPCGDAGVYPAEIALGGFWDCSLY